MAGAAARATLAVIAAETEVTSTARREIIIVASMIAS
jgi:hypothetical protein